MKPEVAVFTKDAPCTKADLWRCFRTTARGFTPVQVDVAHSIVGKNAPRYLERQEYLVKETVKLVEYYKLTPLGQEWLTTGIKAYARNHPIEASKLFFLPGSAASARVTRRRR